MRKPKLVGPQAIVGWRRDGQPIRMIGGGAPDNDDDTKDQAKQQDGDKNAATLLESDADDLTGDGDNEGDTDDSGDDKTKNGGSVDKDALVAEVTKSLETKIASMFDRRVNAVLKEIRKTGATGQDDKAGGKTGDTTTPDAGTAPDLRGARMAFREYISDEIRYISQEERRFGTDLGQALLRAKAADGFDDEDRTGREIAQQVAQQVKALRKHYETRTLAALKKRGALVDKPGQTAAGPNGGVGAQSEYQKGAEIAKARFADRITAKT